MELADLGGTSSLLHFEDSPRTRLELGTTHPGGLAQFITGKTTPFELIRDDGALRTAKIAAGAIAAKSLELATARGIDGVHLGIGWRSGATGDRVPGAGAAASPRHPPARPHFELKLRGTAVPNPAFACALEAQFGVVLDAASLLPHSAKTPTAPSSRMPPSTGSAGLTGHLEWFTVSPRLVVSSFASRSHKAMVRRCPRSRVVRGAPMRTSPRNAAARGGADRRVLARQAVAASSDERAETDTLLLDADGEQDGTLAQIASGPSPVVEDPPRHRRHPDRGERHRRLGPRRTSGRSWSAPAAHPCTASRERPHRHWGCQASPSRHAASAATSCARSRAARRPKKPDLDDVDDALVRLRKVLLDYRGALSKRDPALTVSVLDCLAELSRLALLPTPPSTTARLEPGCGGAALHGPRASPPTPWSRPHGSVSPARARRLPVVRRQLRGHRRGPACARACPQRLHEEELPRLLVHANALVAGTQMRPFQTVNELGIYLRLLAELPRHPRQVPADRVRPLARRADRGDGAQARAPRDDQRQPPTPQEARTRVRAPGRAHR